MRSALEFFATAQSCCEGCQAYKNDVHLLPTELDEKVAKMRLPALGTLLTDFLDLSSSEKFKNSPLVAAHPS